MQSKTKYSYIYKYLLFQDIIIQKMQNIFKIFFPCKLILFSQS